MLNPFPYQLEAIEKTREAMRAGKRSVIICMLMGAGKTLVAMKLMHLCSEKGKRALFMCDRRMLATQALERAHEEGLDAGIIMAGRGVDLKAPCQFASKQTVESWTKNDRVELPNFDLIINDECHRGVSPAYVKLWNRWPNAFRIGLSATPVLGNGNGMGAYYKAMIQTIMPSQLREMGRIVKVRGFAPHIPNLEGVAKDKNGDYRPSALAERMKRENMVGDIPGWWTRFAKDRKSVYFGCDVAHAMAIRDDFRAAGVKAEIIFDETDDEERERIRALSESGEITVVVNCDVLAEGIDWPWIECIGMVRPTKRLRRFLQCAGRGMRSHPGKEDCILIDHAGCLLYHGFPDRDIEWPLDPCDNIDKVNEKKAKESATMICVKCSAVFSGTRTCPECGHVHIIERVARELATAGGTLTEIERDEIPEEMKEAAYQRYWALCIGTAIKRNRTAGMAAGMFSGKFKIPPWQAGVNPLVQGSDWKRPARDVFPGFVRGRQKVTHGDAWEGE